MHSLSRSSLFDSYTNTKFGGIDSFRPQDMKTLKSFHEIKDDRVKIYSIHEPENEIQKKPILFDKIQIICGNSLFNELTSNFTADEVRHFLDVNQSHPFIRICLEFTKKKCKKLKAIEVRQNSYYIEEDTFYQVITRIGNASAVILARYSYKNESDCLFTKISVCHINNNAESFDAILSQLQKVSERIELFIIRDAMLPANIEKVIFNQIKFYTSIGKCQIVVVENIKFAGQNSLLIIDRERNPIVFFSKHRQNRGNIMTQDSTSLLTLGLIPSPLCPFNDIYDGTSSRFPYKIHTFRKKNVEITSVYNSDNPLSNLSKRLYRFQIIPQFNVDGFSENFFSIHEQREFEFTISRCVPTRIIRKIRKNKKKNKITVLEDRYLIPEHRCQELSAKVDSTSGVIIFRSYFRCQGRDQNKCSIWNFRKETETITTILHELIARSDVIDIFIVTGREMEMNKLRIIYDKIEQLDSNYCPLIIHDAVSCVFKGQNAEVTPDLDRNPVIIFGS